MVQRGGIAACSTWPLCAHACTHNNLLSTDHEALLKVLTVEQCPWGRDPSLLWFLMTLQSASQQVNGIERQKPWLCMTLWQAYYVTLKKLLFICFPSILCLLKAVFSLGHHPLPACLSLVSFLLWEPYLHFQSSYYSQQPKAPEFLAREREEGGFSSTW